MSVTVNHTRKAVEIAWETGNPPVEPPEEKPPGFPSHPIELPPEGGWPQPPHPAHPIELPPEGGQPEPPPGVPAHPIFLPPYIDNSLPGPQPRPEHPIELPPEGGQPEPPQPPEGAFPGDPGYAPPPGAAVPTPQHGTVLAVQVFAQGQDGDWSNTPVMPNDGLAVLTYPMDFEGESYVEVRDLFGNLIDYGTIMVEAG